MYLKSITTEVPETAYTQKECWEILKNTDSFNLLLPRSQRITKKVLTGNSGISKRHFAMSNISTIFDRNSQELNQGFEKEAPKLAAKALKKALSEANLKPADLDALFVCTCTGYLCPGVSSHIAEQLNLRSNIHLQDLVGLGCGAAIPTLQSASHFIAAHPTARVACVAVEICSAAFYMDNDPGVLISMCLFGDGASAVILDNTKSNSIGSFSQFESLHLPQYREELRFVNQNGKLKNKLHVSVPIIAGKAVKLLLDQSIADEKYPEVLCHPGGRNVLDEIETVLKIPTIKSSREVLNRYGNMSSPSILFVLKNKIDHQKSPDKSCRLVTFGAGFSAHSCQFDFH